jgi:hypothetical protein
LKFCLGHLEEGFRGASSHENRTASTKSSFILACMERTPKSKPRAFAKPYCCRRNRSYAVATSQPDIASACD